MKHLVKSALCLALAAAVAFGADAPRPTLPVDQRTNGRHTVAALEKIAPLTLNCTARIESVLGRLICAATIVGEDGYILTKASEVPDITAARIHFTDGRRAELREIRREPRYDLVLAQAIGISGLRAASWGAGRKLGLGEWLCSSTDGGKDPRLGVISARTRPIAGLGAALGIRMDDKAPPSSKGVRIVGVASDSPAEAAGLHENDVLLSIADETVAEFKRVHEIVSHRQPGEILEVRFLRKGKEQTCRVRLASRSKVIQNWEGEDFANGGISLRTDNFPEVLQHATPLFPTDMGGPLATLEGQIVGINIARVDRVTTFALPVEAFWTVAQQWIEADRHPPKAVPVK